MSDIDYGARARLDYIEKQLQFLFEGRYVPFAAAMTNGVPLEVLELARAGKKIEAIRIYREATGVSLAEAKEIIDQLR
jgi:hypothetical protein